MGVKEDLEKVISGRDDFPERLLSFLAENPNPADRDFHRWAERQGVDVSDAESLAYEFASNYAKLLLTDGRANEDGLTAEDVSKTELEMGDAVELEHTDDPRLARKIALDHLAELPDYYTRLKKMENQ